MAYWDNERYEGEWRLQGRQGRRRVHGRRYEGGV